MPAVLLCLGSVLVVAGVFAMFGAGPALIVAGAVVFAAGVDLSRTEKPAVPAEVKKRKRWTGLLEDEAA